MVIRGALGAIAAMTFATPAQAALPGLSFAQCFGEGLAGCTGVPGLDGGTAASPAIAATADGKHVYVASRSDSAVSLYVRDGAGRLTFGGCWTKQGEGAEGCTPVVGPSFDPLVDIAVSPDGKHVYTLDGDGGGVRGFTRDADSGALTYGPLLSVNPTGISGGVALAFADDAALYVVSTDTVSSLGRDPATGALSNQGCRGEAGPPCVALEVPLAGVRDVVAERVGGDVFVYISRTDAVVAVRDEGGIGMFTGAVCRGILEGCPAAAGVEGAGALALAPDAGGTMRLAVTSAETDAVAFLRRSGGHTDLAGESCLEQAPAGDGCVATAAPLQDADGVVAADANLFYVLSSNVSSVTEVQPSPLAAGACAGAPAGCVAAPGLGAPAAAAVAAGQLYVAGAEPRGLVVLDRHGVTPPPPPPPPPPAAQRAPSCTGASVTLIAGRATAVPLTCTDPDGDVVTRQIVDAPAHAVLDPVDQAAGMVTVTPDTTYRGLDSLIFRGTDPSGNSSGDATVAIRVAHPSALPALTRVTRVRVPASVRARKGRRGRLTVRWRQGSASDVLLTFHRIDSRGRSEQQVPAVVLDNGQRGANRATVVLPRTIVDGRYRVRLRAVSEDGREGAAARSRVFRVSGTGRGETGARR